MTNSVTKTYTVNQNFTMHGQNFYDDEVLSEREILKRAGIKNPKKDGALSGLVHRGVLSVIYDTPEIPEEKDCKSSEEIEQRIENSDEYSVQPKPNRGRKTKQADISLNDQRLVDEAEEISESAQG